MNDNKNPYIKRPTEISTDGYEDYKTRKLPKLPPVPNRAHTEMRADYPMTADDGYDGEDFEKCDKEAEYRD